MILAAGWRTSYITARDKVGIPIWRLFQNLGDRGWCWGAGVVLDVGRGGLTWDVI